MKKIELTEAKMHIIDGCNTVGDKTVFPSFIQRRMKVGYVQAVDILNALVDEGFLTSEKTAFGYIYKLI